MAGFFMNADLNGSVAHFKCNDKSEFLSFAVLKSADQLKKIDGVAPLFKSI